MSAKCVIKKLENEGYITVKQYVNMVDGYYEINSKYREAIDRIVAENDGEFLTFVFNTTHTGMDILDLEKVHERLKIEAEKHPKSEVLEIYRPLGRFENSKELRRWINNNTDFQFGGKADGVFRSGFKVINKKVKAENMIKKEEERIKFLNFLNNMECDTMILKELHNFVNYNKRETYERLIKNEVLPILFDTSVMKLHIVELYDGNQIIIDNVGVLPSPALIDLIKSIDEFRYIIIDYEAPDKVIGYDSMHEVLNYFDKIGGFDELQPEDIEFLRMRIMEE